MTLREYAQNNPAPAEPEPAPAPRSERQAGTSSEGAAGQAARILHEYDINRQAAEGCKAQILHDIKRKQNPYLLLLLAAEAIGRLTGEGDNFLLEVNESLERVHGKDIAKAIDE